MRIATPVGDLCLDQRARAVGQGRADLDAFVHGAGMHHQGVLLGHGHPLLVDLVVTHVLPLAGQQSRFLTLFLYPERHHHVGVSYGGVQVDLHREPFEAEGAGNVRWQQGGRAAQDHVRPHFP